MDEQNREPDANDSGENANDKEGANAKEQTPPNANNTPAKPIPAQGKPVGESSKGNNNALIFIGLGILALLGWKAISGNDEDEKKRKELEEENEELKEENERLQEEKEDEEIRQRRKQKRISRGSAFFD